jgi:hypothetical protein
MSGLYNTLFGENDKSGFLLGLLGKEAGDFGRYRDVFVTDEYIVVHTRCGGGNREDYEDVFTEMSNHPLYAFDDDDSFDETYADIYFNYPAGYEEILTEMSKGTITPSEKWKMLFDALGK